MTQDEIIGFDFVSVYDVEAHAGLSKCVEGFRNDGEDLTDTAITSFEGDPDYVKIGKDGTVYFIVIESIKAVLYFEVEATFDDRIKRVIADYVGDGASEVFTDRDVRSWKDFESVDVGVAYRGGRGYVYSLAEVSPEWWKSNA